MTRRFRIPAHWAMLMGSILFFCQPTLAASSTTTTLAISPTSTTAGSIITLTATVTSGGVPLTAGQVTFCNASATYCDNGAMLGSVWLTSSGTATLRRALPVGTTNVQAVFPPTNFYATSTSRAEEVVVSGSEPTSTTQTFPTEQLTTQSLISGDFNNDGYPDLVAIDADGASSLYLGKGNGTFVAGPVPTFLSSTGSWATADFNRDGNLDLVGGTPPRLFLGDGAGTFTAGQVLPIADAGSIQNSIVLVGDFNGDGLADIAFVSGNRVQVFIGNGDGAFTSGQVSTFGEAGEAAIGAAAGHFTSAGNLSLIVGTKLASGVGNTYILEGSGTGAFVLVQAIPGASSNYYALGDFNGDGLLDFAMDGGGEVRVELGSAIGTFSEGTPLSGYVYGQFVAADFNGDGFTDLAWNAGGSPASVVVAPGNGNGTFGAALNYNALNTSNEFALATGDFVSSGLPSVAIGSGSPSYITIFPQVGTPAFASSVQLPDTAAAKLQSVSRQTLRALTSDLKLSPMVISLPAAGNITTVAGTGTAGYNGDNIAADIAELYNTYGVAVDASGNLYIADYNNNRIRKVTASTGIITTVAGTGKAGYNGDNIAATSAEINTPTNIALDGAGNIYIADWGNHRIRKVTVSTGIITTVAGTGTLGYNGDNIAATSAKLHNPASVVLDASGNIYIADTYNHRIREVTVSSGIITTVAGTGTAGYNGDNIAATSAKIDASEGVTLDGAGDIYISDTGNNRIRKVTLSTGIISTVAGTGTAGYNGDGVAATSAELDYPFAIALDGIGNLYIADILNSRLREVRASTGLISTLTGGGGASPFNWLGLATGADATPGGVAVDTSGHIYLADPNHNAVFAVGIVKVTPTVTVSVSPSAVTYGSVSSTFTATVSSGTGTVTFSNGAGWTSSAIALGGGTATTSISSVGWAAGLYTITATYSGDGEDNSASGTTVFTVNPAVLTVTANSASKSYGASLPVLTPSYSGFEDGDTSAVLTGSPSLTTTATAASAVGSYTITAAAGTLSAANYLFTFVNGTLTVTKATSVLSVTSSLDPSVFGNIVTFTLTVGGSGSGVVPTGTVTFTEDGTTLLPTTALNGSGQATYITSTLPAGSNTLTLTYSGDTNYF